MGDEGDLGHDSIHLILGPVGRGGTLVESSRALQHHAGTLGVFAMKNAGQRANFRGGRMSWRHE
jgi:hypothetical protein